MKEIRPSIFQQLQQHKKALLEPKYIFAQPSRPLAEESRVCAPISHPNVGKYALGLRFTREVPNSTHALQAHDLGARLTVSFRANDTQQTFECGEGPGSYWTPKEFGLIYLHYAVPADVPREAELEIVVSVPAGGSLYAEWTGTWFVRVEPELPALGLVDDA